MKKVFVILLCSILSINGYCQSDFEVAQSFMNEKGVKLSTKAETRSTADYSLFSSEDGIGYAVVMNGRVVAYSTKESSDKFELMCSKTRTFELTPKYPIEPMIDCEYYGQSMSPFWDMTPMAEDNNGEMIHCPVGCGPIAVVKIMYYYKNPRSEAIPACNLGSSYPYLEELPPTTFNWKLIRSSYLGGKYTKEQGEEVAKLAKYVGYAFQTMYSWNSSGSWLKREKFKLLGFSDETYTSLDDRWDSLMGTWTWFNAFDEWKVSDEKLESEIDKALENGRPLLMAGYNREGAGGHWYVIDGRDNSGMYHIQGSGYYILSQEMYMSEAYNNHLLGLLNKVWLVVPVMPKGWTNINAVKEDKANDDIVYSLSGRKVGNSLEGLPMGVYIKGGKKFIVK